MQFILTGSYHKENKYSLIFWDKQFTVEWKYTVTLRTQIPSVQNMQLLKEVGLMTSETQSINIWAQFRKFTPIWCLEEV